MVDKRLPDRFWDKVQFEPNTGCWLWDGARTLHGYGSYWSGTVMSRAHRISYEALRGEIPDGFQIDHLCRVRCCVNPDHLEPVTPSENAKRGDAGSVWASLMRAVTHCPQGHKYTEENTYVSKKGWRYCRACQNERSRKRRAKKKNDQS